jgi:8-oxo-dGTP pyrophosphatase MutT (NUDIX family)
MIDDRFDPERLREELSKLTREPARHWHGRGGFEFPELHRSAVLIPVTEVDGALEMLFTHRSEDLDRHSGEVSFPGGREEGDDNTLVETALREAHEEVGLQPGDVDVYGALTEMPTVTGFQVTAYVGEFPQPYELVADSGEIETIFQARLQRLADPSLHRLEEREYGGNVFPVHFFEYGDHTIWGATGWLLYIFLDHFELLDPERRLDD